MRLNSVLSLNLHIFLSMEAAMTLVNIHICTGSTEPSLYHTVISTKIKYAGLFDLFFKLNQAKLDVLQIQIDDNYRDKHEGCLMWTEI